MIRSAAPTDLPLIAAIQAASPEASQWKPEDYLGYSCCLADDAAFIVTREVAPGEFEILNLAVTPSARRQGHAKALLAHVLRASGTWFLEVRASNSAALRLYESTGFLPIGSRQNYYGGSQESAIVMRYQK